MVGLLEFGFSVCKIVSGSLKDGVGKIQDALVFFWYWSYKCKVIVAVRSGAEGIDLMMLVADILETAHLVQNGPCLEWFSIFGHEKQT